MSEENVTFDDVTKICGRLLKPAVRSRIKFASDLIAEFSRLVDEAAKRNAAADEAAERREESKAFEPKAITQNLFNLKPE